MKIILDGHRVSAVEGSGSPLTGKLQFTGNRVELSGSLFETTGTTLLFLTTDITGLGHDGRKLTVRTQTATWTLDLWGFGDYGEAAKAAFAARVGQPLETRTLTFYEKNFLGGVLVIAVVFAVGLGLILRDAKKSSEADDAAAAKDSDIPASVASLIHDKPRTTPTSATPAPPAQSALATTVNAAATDSNPAQLRALLKANPGAAKLTSIGGCDSPLHAAAMVGYPKNVALLLKHGAPVSQPGCFKNTPLHVAVGYCNRPQVVNLLLKHKAAVNAKGDTGARPLHVAAAEGCLPFIKRLLKAGAKINAKNELDETPLSHATGAVAAYLKSRGAKE